MLGLKLLGGVVVTTGVPDVVVHVCCACGRTRIICCAWGAGWQTGAGAGAGAGGVTLTIGAGAGVGLSQIIIFFFTSSVHPQSPFFVSILSKDFSWDRANRQNNAKSIKLVLIFVFFGYLLNFSWYLYHFRKIFWNKLIIFCIEKLPLSVFLVF
jgi:hypothetical protein